MKLSKLVTLIIIVAFAMAPTAADVKCTIKIDDESGCNAKDLNQTVSLLNMKFKESRTRTRYLNEHDEKAFQTSLRGPNTLTERKLPSCSQCDPADRYGYVLCTQYYNCGGRRDLASQDAVEFGRLIKSYLGTFGWNGCNPSKLKSMSCNDV